MADHRSLPGTGQIEHRSTRRLFAGRPENKGVVA